MNSEVPQIPESEPNKSPSEHGSSDAADSLNYIESEAQLDSESSASSADMWMDDQEDLEEENIIDSLMTEETENIADIPEATVELVDDQGLIYESSSSLDLPSESSESENSEEFQETNLIESTVAEEKVTSKQGEAELFTDTWLDEPENITTNSPKKKTTEELTSQIAALEQKKATLIEEIRLLEKEKQEAMSLQVQDLQRALGQMIEEGMEELRERKHNTLIDLEKLERRRERIHQEMRTNFAGASQDLAVRIQGFKEYLVGSLQDLVTAAEQLELSQKRSPIPTREARESRDVRDVRDTREYRVTRDTRSGNQPPRRSQRATQPKFTEQAFSDQTRKIGQILEQYRINPDYYGPPWQLRRTFEPIHEERVKDWFFVKGGRGAIKGAGSRLQNILVSAGIISVLYRLYRDRCRILILVDTPEKLGEWRRGLQDCLGITRGDFGSSRGVVLFESADVLVQRAERLLQDKLFPLIIIDETEESINLSLLKFPLWLAFTAESQSKTTGYLY